MKQKRIFKIIAAGIVIAAIAVLIYNRFSYKETSTKRPRYAYKKKIEQIKSGIDKDGDGVDDQSDILESALEYIQTKPKYESRYYIGGTPNDGYGVCTDVVAAALLGAGYDLQKLVDKDIREHPENYDIQSPDENIDYCRVRNLQVYFKNNTKSLTTDISEIEDEDFKEEIKKMEFELIDFEIELNSLENIYFEIIKKIYGEIKKYSIFKREDNNFKIKKLHII